MPAARNSADDDVPDDWLESPESEPTRPVDQMEPAEAWNPDSQAHPIDDPEPVTSDVARPMGDGEEIKPSPAPSGGKLKYIAIVSVAVVLLGAGGIWWSGSLSNGKQQVAVSQASGGTDVTNPILPPPSQDPTQKPTEDPLPTKPPPTPPGPNSTLPPIDPKFQKELELLEESPKDRIKNITAFVDTLASSSDRPNKAEVEKYLEKVNNLLKSTTDEAERVKLESWQRHLQYILKLVSAYSPPDHFDQGIQSLRPKELPVQNNLSDRPSGGFGGPIALLAMAFFGALDDAWPVPENFDSSWLIGDRKTNWEKLERDWTATNQWFLRANLLVQASELAHAASQPMVSEFYHKEATAKLPVTPATFFDKQAVNELSSRLTRLRAEHTHAQLQSLRKELQVARDDLKIAQTDVAGAKSDVEKLTKDRVTAAQAVLAVSRRAAEDLMKRHRLADRWKTLEPKEGDIAPGVNFEARKQEWDQEGKQLAEIQDRLSKNAGSYAEVADDHASLGQILSLVEAWEGERDVADRVKKAKLSSEEFQKFFGTELERQLKKDGKLSLWETLQKLTWPTKEGKLVVDKDVETIAETEVAKKLKELIDAPAVSKVLAALVQTMELGFAKQIATLTKADTELRREIEQAKTGNQTSLDQAKTELTQKIGKASDSWTSELKKADLTWSERLELAANGLREEIKATLMKPRPLPDDQVSRMGDQVAESVKKRLFEWGYVPPEAPPTDRPYRGNFFPDPEKGSRCFQRGYGAYLQPSPAAAQEAVRHFSMACQFDPEVALYRYYLGLAQHRCGDVEAGALQVRCGAELELGRPDRNLGRQLEPVQGPRRQWLERIRDSIHLAPVRLNSQETR